MPTQVSGQLGSARLGLFGLGQPGPLTVQQVRINAFTAVSIFPTQPGKPVLLSWDTTFASGVTISGVGTVASSGSATVNPTVNTTYTLTGSGPGGPVTRGVTVTVDIGPQAVHTFDFLHVYLSTRTGGAPGSGIWTNPITIFDGTISSDFFEASTFSAGALGPTDPNNGIVCRVQNSGDTVDGLTFLGNGRPTVPIRIAFTGQPTNLFGEDYWNLTQGAWAYGGAFYIATVGIVSTFPNVLVVIKSTDNGATWAIQDAANSPSPQFGDGIESSVQRVNNRICVFTNSTGSTFALWEFDLTTDTWGPEFADIGLPNFSNFSSQDSWTNGLHKFPNGDYLTVYVDSVLGPACRLWNGTSWAAPQPLPGLEYANSVMDPDFSGVYILTYDVNSKAAAVHCSRFTHAGSIVSPDLAIIPAGVSGSSDGVGHSSIQNGMLFVPRDDSADFDNAVWVASLPVTAFVKELLPIPPGESNAITQFSIHPNGTGYAVNDTGTIDGGTPGFLSTYQILAVTTGAISSWNFTIGGTGYVPGDTGTIQSGGFDAAFSVTATTPGGVASVSINNGGTGYAPNDTGFLTGGGITATYKVTAVGGGGVATGVSITIPGTGYAPATGVTTTDGGTQPGVGTGLKLNILSIGDTITAISLTNLGHGYTVGNGITTHTTSGSGSGFIIDVTATFNGVSNLSITNGEEGGGYSVGLHTTTNGGAQPGVGGGLQINVLAVGGKTPSCAYMMFPNGYSSTLDPLSFPIGVGASFVFNPGGGPSPVASAKHAVCVQNVSGGGVLTDIPYIVRKYTFNNEPFPPDTLLMTPWSDFSYQFQKTARNIIIDLDTASVPCTIQLQTDGGAAETFTTTTTSHDRDRVLSCNSDLEGKLWRCTFTPGTGGKAQVFSIGLDFLPDTNILTQADSYEQNLGYVGWKALKQCWVQYKGGPLTLTFLVDGGSVFYTITLPAHSVRDIARFYFPAVNGGVLNKSRKYRIQMSAANGFRLYADSLLEFIPFGADQRGSFNLMNISPEMKVPIEQPTTGMWTL